MTGKTVLKPVPGLCETDVHMTLLAVEHDEYWEIERNRNILVTPPIFMDCDGYSECNATSSRCFRWLHRQDGCIGSRDDAHAKE